MKSNFFAFKSSELAIKRCIYSKKEKIPFKVSVLYPVVSLNYFKTRLVSIFICKFEFVILNQYGTLVDFMI